MRCYITNPCSYAVHSTALAISNVSWVSKGYISHSPCVSQKGCLLLLQGQGFDLNNLA